MRAELLNLYNDTRTIPVKWLWYPYIAVGRITLLQGDPGDGKSTMMLNLSAGLSKGRRTPEGRTFGRRYRVIYQCSEDGVADTIKHKLELYGADCTRIAFINEKVHEDLTLGDDRIREAITTFKPDLVVIDPVKNYIVNEFELQNAVRVRKLLRRISLWAATYDCAIVLIDNLGKNSGSKQKNKGYGCIGAATMVRSILRIERSSIDEDIFSVKQIKNSLSARGKDIQFEIKPETGFKWLDSSENSTTLSQSAETVTFDVLSKDRYEVAAFLLKQLLSDDPISSTEVKEALKEFNVSENTMREAKAMLGIKSYRKMHKWYWQMPGMEPHDQQKSDSLLRLGKDSSSISKRCQKR